MNIEIIPLKGIKVDSNEINLGSSLEDLKSILGEPLIVGNRFYYFDSDLAFDFNKKNEIEFIEFLGGMHDKLKPVIYGKRVFETHSDELRNLLSSKDQGEVDTSDRYSIDFKNISVGLYQEANLEEVNEMIEEVKNDGTYEEMKDAIEADIWMANHYSTIGIGIPGYYNNITLEE